MAPIVQHGTSSIAPPAGQAASPCKAMVWLMLCGVYGGSRPSAGPVARWHSAVVSAPAGERVSGWEGIYLSWAPVSLWLLPWLRGSEGGEDEGNTSQIKKTTQRPENKQTNKQTN